MKLRSLGVSSLGTSGSLVHRCALHAATGSAWRLRIRDLSLVLDAAQQIARSLALELLHLQVFIEHFLVLSDRLQHLRWCHVLIVEGRQSRRTELRICLHEQRSW